MQARQTTRTTQCAPRPSRLQASCMQGSRFLQPPIVLPLALLAQSSPSHVLRLEAIMQGRCWRPREGKAGSVGCGVICGLAQTASPPVTRATRLGKLVASREAVQSLSNLQKSPEESS